MVGRVLTIKKFSAGKVFAFVSIYIPLRNFAAVVDKMNLKIEAYNVLVHIPQRTACSKSAHVN